DHQLGSGSTIGSAPTQAGRTILQDNAGLRVTTAALLQHLPAAQSPQTGTVHYCFNPTPWTSAGAAPPAVTSTAVGLICAFPPAAGGTAIPEQIWSVLSVPVGTLTNSNTIVLNDWQWSGRVDHPFNSKNPASMRYMYDDRHNDGVGQATPKGLAALNRERS